MYSQRAPHSAPGLYPGYPTFASGGNLRRPLPRPPARSAPTSPMQMDCHTSQMTIHDLLDSTTLEVGFDHTCLEGLTGDLLFSPVDAFAQSCYETLFPEHHHKPRTPTYDPPSYTPYPELNDIPEKPTTITTTTVEATGPVRSDDESYLQVGEEDDSSDAGSIQNESGAGCFWDDSDASGDYPETVSSSSDNDEDKHSDASFRFGSVKNRPVRNRPIIDTDFMGGVVVPSSVSGNDWEKAFISWQESLPGHVEVAVDLSDTRSKDSQKKKVSRIAALRAKIPPIRTSSRRTPLYNPRS